MAEYKVKEIETAIKAISDSQDGRYSGFSGSCASFAAVLNRVFEGGGSYLIVDSGHYQYADHVAVILKGRIFDADGLTTRKAFKSKWCHDGETVEMFNDDSSEGLYVRNLEDGGLCGLNQAAMEDDLRTLLDQVTSLPKWP